MKINISSINFEIDIVVAASGESCAAPCIQQGGALWTAAQCRGLAMALNTVADEIDRENEVTV